MLSIGFAQICVAGAGVNVGTIDEYTSNSEGAVLYTRSTISLHWYYTQHVTSRL
jgi:hypothetical protein